MSTHLNTDATTGPESIPCVWASNSESSKSMRCCRVSFSAPAADSWSSSARIWPSRLLTCASKLAAAALSTDFSLSNVLIWFVRALIWSSSSESCGPIGWSVAGATAGVAAGASVGAAVWAAVWATAGAAAGAAGSLLRRWEPLPFLGFGFLLAPRLLILTGGDASITLASSLTSWTVWISLSLLDAFENSSNFVCRTWHSEIRQNQVSKWVTREF